LLAATRGYGGEVVLYDRSGPTREEIGKRLAEERNLILIPPFDHADVIAGRYRSEAIGTTATVSMTDAGPRLTTVGRFGSAVFDLECIASGIWRTKPAKLPFLGGLLSFDRAAGTFRFSNYQTRALVFQRIP